MTENELIKGIEEWFDNNSSNKRIWKTKLGEYLKNKLTKRGNFKYAKRGNPKKGMEKSQLAALNKQLAAPKYEAPKEKERTHTEWLLLHLKYLENKNNEIKAFKRNNYKAINGDDIWYNNKTHKPVNPPEEPINDLDQYIEFCSVDIF